ncbi:MAG: hypothetical protein N2738_05820, partial [Thermodesulfovibrionales bacterium]|nr:hypothetical protein [Thermodesulfovibrionales bacterium]
AEIFAKAMEKAIVSIDDKARDSITERKEHIKIEIREELKKELVTRELFEEKFKVIDERFKSMDERFKSIDERFKSMDVRFKAIDERFNNLNFKLNIFIAIALAALTLANPTFAELVKGLMK